MINFKFLTKNGLTIIEMLAVVAIIAVLATITTGAFYSLRRQSALDAATENIIALLNQARTKTLASENDSEFGLHFETAKAVMFKGIAYSATSSNNEAFNLPSPVEMSDISFGGNEFFFKKFTGNASQAGTVVLKLKSDSSKFKKIIIGPAGVVYVEN